ncbi:MAG: Spore germination protein A3 precursor [Pelotomaculum sp. PtaU1.Bin035]|nr:MAG: Spore germination protein A3 precursor [Pelotomaculum sp. PtaU1.Bin035]
MRAAKFGALFLTSLAFLLLTGCFGSRETDETGYILAMGIDKGEKDNMVVTVSIANTKAIAGMTGPGGGIGGARNTLVQSVETYGPLTSLEQFDTAVSRHLSLLHTKAYIFSEEFAREGLESWFGTLSRYYELRATSYVFVCRGKAKDFLEKNQPPLEISPTKQYEIIGNLYKSHGLYQSNMFKDFYQHIKSWTTGPSLPLVAIHEGGLETAKPGYNKGGELGGGKYVAGEVPISGENKAQFCGTAVFLSDKMVGTLNGEETRYYLMLRGEFNNGFIIISYPLVPENALGLIVHQARSPKYATTINDDGTVTIDVDIYLEADLAGTLSNVDFESTDVIPIIEGAFSSHVQQECQRLINRTQKEFKSDICGFGEQVKGHFWTVQPWREFNWNQKYPEAAVNVTAHTRIRRTGLKLKTSPVWEGGE